MRERIIYKIMRPNDRMPWLHELDYYFTKTIPAKIIRLNIFKTVNISNSVSTDDLDSAMFWAIYTCYILPSEASGAFRLLTSRRFELYIGLSVSAEKQHIDDGSPKTQHRASNGLPNFNKMKRKKTKNEMLFFCSCGWKKKHTQLKGGMTNIRAHKSALDIWEKVVTSCYSKASRCALISSFWNILVFCNRMLLPPTYIEI